MKKVLGAVLTAGALVFSYTSAHALASWSSTFVSGVVNTFSDDDGEVLVNKDGSGGISPLTGVASPTISVGDYLVGTLGITSFPTSGTDASTVNQVTAMFAVEVTSVTAIPDAVCFPNLTGGSFLINTGACAGFRFAPTGDFNAAVSGAFPNLFTNLGVPNFLDVDGSALPTNTIALVWEDPNHDYNRDAVGDVDGDGTPDTLDDAALAAANGTLRMVLGAEGGDQWTGSGPVYVNDAGIEALLSPTGVAQVGQFSATLTILSHSFGPLYILGPKLTVTNGAFSGDLNLSVPWDVSSNADFQFNISVIPEPGTMLLLGTGLLGLGALGRRRKS
jgi:hypothetical protein